MHGDRRRGTVVTSRELEPADVEAALGALAAIYCRSATSAGATPEQALAAVAGTLAEIAAGSGGGGRTGAPPRFG